MGTKRNSKWLVLGILYLAIAILVIMAAISMTRPSRRSNQGQQQATMPDPSYENEIEIQNDEKIEIDMSLARVEIEQSDNDKMKIEYRIVNSSNESVPTFSVDQSDGVTKLKQSASAGEVFNIGINDLWNRIILRVQLPQGYNGEMNIEVAAGETKIMDGIHCASLSVNNDLGAITVQQATIASNLQLKASSGRVILKDSSASEANIEAKLGEVEISECELTALTAKADSGRIKLEDVTVTGDIKTDTGLGAVDIIGGSAISLEAKANSGSVKVKKISLESASLASDMGSITFEPTTPCEAKLQTNMGSIQAKFPDGMGYTLEAKAKTGSVKAPSGATVDGDVYTVGDGQYQVTVHTDLGSIEVN